MKFRLGMLTPGGTRSDSPYLKSNDFTWPAKAALKRRYGTSSSTSSVQPTSDRAGRRIAVSFMSLSLDEPGPELRGGHHARIEAAEPAISVSGDQVVRPVANRPRDDADRAQEPPRPAKVARYPYRRVGLHVRLAVSHEDEGLCVVRIEAKVAHEKRSQG